jgi:hypothetical protein
VFYTNNFLDIITLSLEASVFKLSTVQQFPEHGERVNEIPNECLINLNFSVQVCSFTKDAHISNNTKREEKSKKVDY